MKKFIIFVASVFLICSCNNNKQNKSNNDLQNKFISFDEKGNRIHERLEGISSKKNIEEDGFVWYKFHTESRTKNTEFKYGVMNEKKKIIIEPFWGNVSYNTKDKRFHTYLIKNDHTYAGLYERDGSCVIPESMQYFYISYESDIIHSYYEIGYMGRGGHGVCDMYGKVLIEPGEQDYVEYKYVEKYNKYMFVLSENCEKEYTFFYLDKDGYGHKYGERNHEDDINYTYTNNEFKDNSDLYGNNEGNVRAPISTQCRSCKGSGICGGCNGERKIKQFYNTSTGTWTMRDCHACSGTGICKGCNGDGSIDEGMDF